MAKPLHCTCRDKATFENPNLGCAIGSNGKWAGVRHVDTNRYLFWRDAGVDVRAPDPRGRPLERADGRSGFVFDHRDAEQAGLSNEGLCR